MADEERLRDYLRKVTAELQQARRQLGALAARDAEPVAVIGIGCRLPGGVSSPEDLWELVAARRDVIGPLAADRGWQLDGHRTAVHGGFVDDLAGFDAAFFGIDGGEARAMDPQQRLLLETAWEAVERARIDPTTLHGSRTGVYTGLTSSGYVMALGGAPPPEETLDYLGVGSSPGAAAGRISYLFGLHGPAMTVDTACSSSLVALHVATRALRRGECSLALAGGAAACVLPHVFLEFERRGSLAADGRSKSFSAAGDGVSFAEGVAVLLLERLGDARANGHRVLALIRGSAVNQDGETNGLAAPSSVAQERVIRDALADAGLTADQIDVVEGHGVGAAVADGIEARSLIATYGRERPPDRPVRLGSVKSNIGHTQAAGGVAGVIKTVMALRHRTVPATLHADPPTPHADWSAGTVQLQTEPGPWRPQDGEPRRAAVSCFSISGTNGHLILEEAPEQAAPAPEGGPDVAVPWLVSAKSGPALRAQAERLRALTVPPVRTRPRDIAHSLAFTRSTFKQRAVVVAASAAEFGAALDALAAGADAPGLVRGAADRRGRTALVFPAAADRAPDLGPDRAVPAGAAAWDEVTGELGPVWGPPDSGPGWTRDARAFATQVALFRTAEAFGVVPDVVVGHGIGEIAAAHCAGMLGLQDAAAVVTALGAGDAGAAGAAAREPGGPVVAEPRIPVVFASLGRPVTPADLAGPGGWAERARHPGEPASGLAQLDGVSRRLSLDTDLLDRRRWLTALGDLHVRGVDVDWTGAFAGLDAVAVDLPTYPFQHRTYWLTDLDGVPDRSGTQRGPRLDADDSDDLEDPELVPGFGQRRMNGGRRAAAPVARA